MNSSDWAILLDVDGVIANFCEGVDREIELLGHPRPPWDSWELADNIPKAIEAGVMWALRQPGFASSLDPFPGAIEAVRDELEANKRPIVFVTHRMNGSPTWAHDREEWLKRHFGPKLNIISTGDKFRVRGEWLVEDNAANLAAFVGNRIMIDRPYNRSAPFKHARVTNIKEAFDLIRASKFGLL
jgi:5'(3')-deoxyribonucleotidase